ncbi:MAG TPA: chromate transporter [Sediminispirochaeta sp.]|nr:chromate transporter [Sediminispirochaeta sp.]
MRELWELFAIFFRIGLFSIGGGYVMLPMLRREMVETRRWLSDEELLNYYAIGQATPGIIAINTATFVGYKRRGVPGAIAATAGMVGSSLIIITVIAMFFARMQENPVVQRAFQGVRVAVAMLLSFTVFSLIRKTSKGLGALLVTGAAFVAVALFDLSPIPVLIVAGIIGVLAFGKKPEQGDKSEVRR